MSKNEANSYANCENKDFRPKKENTKWNKFWVILLTLLVLLIPVAFLKGIIDERYEYRMNAVQDIASSWGGEQILSAPYIYYEKQNDAKKEPKTVYLDLNQYSADVIIDTEIRKRGIFKVPVYVADVKLKGDFINNSEDLSQYKTFLSFNVSDTRGFISKPLFKINNQEITANNTKIPITTTNLSKNIPFEISYKIRGINDLKVKTNGQNSKITIKGNWNNPSFVGDFLPISRTIDNDEFYASWNIPYIAYSNINNSNVGVSLLVPVDNYRMAERTLKYAFLFLGLTFMCYFIYEISTKESKKIHPIQYCLLGAAMLMFYLLTVALSEFIPFAFAYFIAALMVILAVGLYTYFVITKKQQKIFSVLIVGLMGLLYCLLYVLLSLQDFALLIASIGLFAIIIVIMFITGKIDWYCDNE